MSGPNIYDMLGYFRNITTPNQQSFGMIDVGEVAQMINLLFTTKGGITATAGGGQSGAFPLTATWNSIDTVATAADSVMLPQALPGRFVFVLNNQTTNSLQVFGQPTNPANANAGDTITPSSSSTPAATGTGVAHAVNKVALYVCMELGNWKQMISA